MSDDRRSDPSPAFSLASPGVVTLNATRPMRDVVMQTFFLGEGRQLQSVKSYLGQHSENQGMHAFDPVDWETTVPVGAQFFSVTAGVAADAVGQFWVGWLRNGHVHMDALTEERPLAAPLAPEERVIFPAVMDGSGSASLFSWQKKGDGAALAQHLFTKKGASTRTLAELPGKPVVSRAAAVPGHGKRAVIGWVEQTESSGSILGLALTEGGRATIWRSAPVTRTVPMAAQRVGVWASEQGDLEVSVVLTGRVESGGHSLARFAVGAGQKTGELTNSPTKLYFGKPVRAAIEYSDSVTRPTSWVYYLMKDGSLWGSGGFDESVGVVRQSVDLDSPLPIVSNYWITRKVGGGVEFQRLRRTELPDDSDMNRLP